MHLILSNFEPIAQKYKIEENVTKDVEEFWHQKKCDSTYLHEFFIIAHHQHFASTNMVIKHPANEQRNKCTLRFVANFSQKSLDP